MDVNPFESPPPTSVDREVKERPIKRPLSVSIISSLIGLESTVVIFLSILAFTFLNPIDESQNFELRILVRVIYVGVGFLPGVVGAIGSWLGLKWGWGFSILYVANQTYPCFRLVMQGKLDSFTLVYSALHLLVGVYLLSPAPLNFFQLTLPKAVLFAVTLSIAAVLQYHACVWIGTFLLLRG